MGDEDPASPRVDEPIKGVDIGPPGDHELDQTAEVGDGMPPGVPRDVPQVIVFKAAGDKGTEMTVTEYGYTTEQARDLSRAGMEQCLDKMAAMFAE